MKTSLERINNKSLISSSGYLTKEKVIFKIWILLMSLLNSSSDYTGFEPILWTSSMSHRKRWFLAVWCTSSLVAPSIWILSKCTHSECLLWHRAQEHAFLGFISFCFLCLVLYFLGYSIPTGTKRTCRGTGRLVKGRDGVRMSRALLRMSLGLGHKLKCCKGSVHLGFSLFVG